jgi:hypothetical protein
MSLNGRDVRLFRGSTSRGYALPLFLDRRARVITPQIASATPTPAAITNPTRRAVPSEFGAGGCGWGVAVDVAVDVAVAVAVGVLVGEMVWVVVEVGGLVGVCVVGGVVGICVGISVGRTTVGCEAF